MKIWQNIEPEEKSWVPPISSRLAAASLVKWRFPIIRPALRANMIVPLEISCMPLDGVVGWGGRFQANFARRYANIRRLRYWSLEDGFLRSVGLGKARHQTLSLLVDDLGLHHDPLVESRLERLIVEGPSAV